MCNHVISGAKHWCMHVSACMGRLYSCTQCWRQSSSQCCRLSHTSCTHFMPPITIGCFGFSQSLLAAVCRGVHGLVTCGTSCATEQSFVVGVCSQQPKCVEPLHVEPACEYMVELDSDLNSQTCMSMLGVCLHAHPAYITFAKHACCASIKTQPVSSHAESYSITTHLCNPKLLSLLQVP